MELGSGSGRRLVRRSALNNLEDVAVCWWPQDDPGPALLWPSALGPAHTDAHNLVLLGCSAADTLKVGPQRVDREIGDRTHTLTDTSVQPLGLSQD